VAQDFMAFQSELQAPTDFT